MFNFFKKKVKKDISPNNYYQQCTCSSCGKINSINANYCGLCGKKLKDDIYTCPNCFTILHGKYNFCYKCGFSLTTENRVEEKKALEPVIDTLDYLEEYYDEKENTIVDETIKDSQYDLIEIGVEQTPTESIDELLIQKVLIFIEENKNPGVYYSVIYGKFKQEFNDIKIFNFKEVKNKIDEYLNDDLFVSEKFISIYRHESEIIAEIERIAKEMDENYSIYDLSRKVPGIQWPVLEDIVNRKEEKKFTEEVEDLFFNNNYYVPINKKEKNVELNIKTETNLINELYEYIIEVLNELDCEMISVNIICSQLQIFRKELYNSLKIDGDINKLCNILRNDLNGKLYINKPFVSNKPIRNSVDVTCDYLRKLPKFDKKDMEDFQYKIGLQSHKSYEIFIEQLENEFVRVDITKMVNKDNIGIDDILLSKIRKCFNLYFKNNKEINTARFRAYAMLPNIGNYKWNKYLLVGILKTYFKEEYEVEKYGKTINDMNYIIRRKNV